MGDGLLQGGADVAPGGIDRVREELLDAVDFSRITVDFACGTTGAVTSTKPNRRSLYL